MPAWLKKLTGWFGDGMLFSGRPDITPMDLEHDWPQVERLMQTEEWPFLRSDLEVGHAQPRAVSRVARKNGAFAGFFTTHHFGDVGYLDMMIIDGEFRSAGVARPLYFSTINEMKRAGMRGFVVHTTNDSARIIRLLGFRPGQDFTLLARDPEPTGMSPGELDEELTLDELVALDAIVFGAPRSEWIEALLHQADTGFVGLRRDGRLVASLCLRPRQGAAICLDQVNALNDEDVVQLVRRAVHHLADQRLECFARTGSVLDGELRALGFEVPEFFVAIGPLVEWRKGRTGDLGTSDRIQCLTWL